MTEEQHAELIAAALAVRERAYAPYSKFQVGAAILTLDGKFFTGCNIENASYGLTMCAERVAAASAVAAGYRQFAAIAVASPAAASPCGACRQVLAEFAPKLPVLLVDSDAPDCPRLTDLGVLLPNQFSSNSVRMNSARTLQ
jgi:cytidine deaminase